MDEEMIEYQEIFSMFNGSNWLHFSEKPKFFFIDVQPMKMERTGLYWNNKEIPLWGILLDKEMSTFHVI